MQHNWFRIRRDELKLSQSAVVREFYKLGVIITVGAISGWENGQVPSIGYTDAIASILKMKPSAVLEAMHQMSRDQSKESAARQAFPTEQA